MKPDHRSPRIARVSPAAFTLIELLTVIAIIGILAAIIIPTVATVRKSARWAQGSSNIRQVAMGMIMMAEENRGRLIRTTELTPNGSSRYWDRLLTQHLNNADMDVSPDRSHKVLLDPLIKAAETSGVYHFAAPYLMMPDRSDTIDARFESGGSWAKVAAFRHLHSFSAPAQQIYFTDAVIRESDGRADGNLHAGDCSVWSLLGWSAADADSPVNPGDGTQGNIRWTDGKARFAFLDGHVKILKQEEVKKRNLSPLLQ
ncbi:MAG: prepilin-type N-terminal cleavage/methylation domain-containing protein [Opitutaceae bacterium]|jgi:prepilin-type N-terminal cleavage/methylation domain-containing protein/prepilin-type processing-associated H-X9-DG protein|nr:prepilin-type N-terminal cleavage/methylation domain-containing protein [Opitutaceae bacterium]